MTQSRFQRARMTFIAAAALGLSANVVQAAEPKAGGSQAELERKLADAQRRLDEAARDVADLSMSLSYAAMPDVKPFPGRGGDRGRLGVNLGPRSAEDLEDGVRIFSVSPGGAAAEAGLKGGDVLLEVNGTQLKRDGDERPRERLVAVLKGVKPGDKVNVRYRREGKVAAAELTARPPADRVFLHSMSPPGAPPGAFVGAPPMAFMRGEGVFGDAELAPLTPKLGAYFGAEKGLLVVRAPADARLKLEDGDVILDIDGRTPTSASHALRILGSYQSGETVKLNVLRARKRISFEVKIPENEWESAVGRGAWPATRVLPAPAPADEVRIIGLEADAPI